MLPMLSYPVFSRSYTDCVFHTANMAINSAICYRMVRVLALVQIITGALLLMFGIGEIIVGRFWTGYVGFGIWTGVWLCVTGSLGIPGSSRERTSLKNALNGVFMGFSITSAVLGGIVIICYSIAIAMYGDYHEAAVAIAALILILGIVNFATGIWAAIGSCFITTCCDIGSVPGQQETQMAYISNPGMPVGGYVMQQGPGGVPVAVPVQGGGMVAVQVPTSAASAGNHPQVVHVPTSMGMGSYPQVPVSGAMAFQPQVVQVSTSGATGGPPQYVQYAGASGAMMGADHSQAEQIPAKM